MNEEITYQSFPFQAFESYFKARYDVARDADRLLIKVTNSNFPYADGRGAVMVELRKWTSDNHLEFWWSRDVVHSAVMWIAAGAQHIDRSVPIAQHVAAKKPIVIPGQTVAPPLKPIPLPKGKDQR
jgi:hypothetical protein